MQISNMLKDKLPDSIYLRLKYFKVFHKFLSLSNPKTFNAKLQWLKLYDRNPEYIKLVDKYEVKKIVGKIIGEEHIIPTFGIWDKFDDIDFSRLPDQFVLKCTHNSGGIVIVPDKKKLDIQNARKKIEASLRTNFFYEGREWPYKHVRPRIIAEKFLTNGKEGLVDYKVHNFNGIPKVILVCKDRFLELGLTEDFFTTEWKHIDVRRDQHPNADTIPKQPDQINELLKLSEQLSSDKAFVRTDFYSIEDTFYFGEITFFPASGFQKFVPEAFDSTLGEWIRLPKKSKDGGGVVR